MEWDLCSSAPWVPFYPYTMFQNPMSKPFCQISEKTIITEKVLVTQSSNIVHCDWQTQKPVCVEFSNLFKHFFPVQIDGGFFFNFLLGGVKQTAKNFTLCWLWLGKNALKLIEWHIYRVSGVPNPAVLVLSLYDKWFLKNENFRRKVV